MLFFYFIDSENEGGKMFRWIAVCMSLMTLTGCMTMARNYVVGKMKEAPMYEFFYIHPGANVGDTALQIPQGEMWEGNGTRVTLIAKEDGLNLVSLEPLNKDIFDYRHVLWVTDEGQVKKAELQYNGEIFPLRVEGVNPENGHFRNVIFEKVAIPQRFESKGRVYNVEYIQTQQISYHSDGVFMGAMDADMTIIIFIDPSVPFGLVKSFMSGKTKKGAGAFDFIGVAMKAANPDVFSSREVLNELYSSSKSTEVEWMMEFTYEPPEAAGHQDH